MKIIGLVACDENCGIAKNGTIPWADTIYGQADLRNFARMSKMGTKPAILMGRKTHESIGRILPKRLNIIIGKPQNNADDTSDMVIYSQDICHAINAAIKRKVSHLYVIGGAQIYNWFATRRLYDEFIATMIPKDYQCDLFISDTINILRTCSRFTNANWTLTDHIDSVTIGGYHYKQYSEDNNYKKLITELLHAPLVSNRTKYKTRVLCNKHLKFSLLGGTLPATTLRRQYLKGIFWELMWFINGRTDLEYLHAHGVHVWDANYEDFNSKNSKSNKDNKNVGPIYGHQWRNFGGEVEYDAECAERASSGFDQLYYIINELRDNPHSRRIMLSSWCPPQIFDACLPPCHVSYNWNVVDGKLYCQVLQRSSDVALALSWNVTSGALLTHMLARICGLEAAEIAITICNAHIYENQESGIKTMLQRESMGFPRVNIRDIKDITTYTFEDMGIYAYRCHGSVAMGEMAV